MRNLHIWLFLLIIPASCNEVPYPLVPENVSNTISESGKNYVELLEAIVEFRKPEDSLKLKSLYHLLAHFPRHGYRTYLLYDSTGNLIDYNISDAGSYDKLIVMRDSIAGEHGKLIFKQHYYGKDIYKITADFLVDHVNESYNVWKDSPWSPAYTFEKYKTSILPMRLNTGPNDDWISIVRDTLLPDFNYSGDSVFDAADSIVKSVSSFLKWDPRYTENPTDQGWVEMNKNKAGRCEDMAVLMVASLRSFGIASAIDFIPLPQEPADRITYWVTVWNPQGKKKHYFPFENQLKKPETFPKVFRRRYHSFDPVLPIDTVYNLLKYQHLEQAAYIDVTDEYTKTTDLYISSDSIQSVADFSKVFLCFKDQGHWIPADWTYYFDDSLFFSKLNPDIRYVLKDLHGQTLFTQP